MPSRGWLTAFALLALSACGPSPGQSRWPKAVLPPVAAAKPPTAAASRVSKSLCVMPVRDGAPGPKDVGAAFRMVSSVAMIPGTDHPWFLAVNRGGQWTLDETGRYVPFPGAPPDDTFKLNLVQEGEGGRVIGGSHGRLIVFNSRTASFDTLVQFGAAGSDWGDSISLARIERQNLTLVSHRDNVFRLVGTRLEAWPESAKLRAAGATTGARAFDLPTFHAILFEAGNGVLALRGDDGGWTTLGRLSRPKEKLHDEYLEKIEPAPASAAALVTTSARYLAVQFASGQPPRLIDIAPVDKSRDHSGAIVFASNATGEIIRFGQPEPAAPPQWGRLTPSGFIPIRGGPAAPYRNGDFIEAYPKNLAGRNQFVFRGRDGYVLYEGGALQPVPSSGGATVGGYPHAEDLPVIRKAFINSDKGLFELTAQGELKPAQVAFATGGLPVPAFAEARRARRAVVLAADGLFALDADGATELIPGGDHLRTSFGAKFLGELPRSGDLLMIANNALYLVVNRASPRWSRCAG